MQRFNVSRGVIFYFLLKKKKKACEKTILCSLCLRLQLGHLATGWSGIERVDNSWSSHKGSVFLKQSFKQSSAAPSPHITAWTPQFTTGSCADAPPLRSKGLDNPSVSDLQSLKMKRGNGSSEGGDSKSVVAVKIWPDTSAAEKPLSGAAEMYGEFHLTGWVRISFMADCVRLCLFSPYVFHASSVKLLFISKRDRPVGAVSMFSVACLTRVNCALTYVVRWKELACSDSSHCLGSDVYVL